MAKSMTEAYNHSLSYCLSNDCCHFRCMSKYSPTNDEVVYFQIYSEYYVTNTGTGTEVRGAG